MTEELNFISRPEGRQGLVASLWVDAGAQEDRIVSRKDATNLACLAVPTVRLTHGAAVGTRQVGEIVTGGTSGATGQVVKNGDGYTLVTQVSGTFEAEELTFGTSGATATATAADAGTATISETVAHDTAQGGDINVEDGTAVFVVWSDGAVSDPTSGVLTSGATAVRCAAAGAPALFVFMAAAL